MNKIQQQLVCALDAFMNKTQVNICLSEPEEWMQLYGLAREHSIIPMVMEMVSKEMMQQLPPQAAVGIQRQNMMSVVMQTQISQRFLAIYRELNKQDIHALVVKGIVCRSIYPEPDFRPSSDEDVFVQESDMERCHTIFLEQGLEVVNGQLEDSQVVTYSCPRTGLHIELHRKLFSKDSKAYGGINEAFEGVFDRAIQLEIDGTKIWTMQETDHMLYLIFHSFKHFLHSGFGIRQVCDIGQFARSYGTKIDWKYIVERTSYFCADVFFMNLLDINCRYIGMNLEEMSFPEQLWKQYEASIDCTELLDDIFLAGIYGKSSDSRTHSSLITLNAVTSKGGSKYQNLLKTIFPSRNDLQGRFPYLKKHGFLLPLAWVQRMISYRKNSQAQSDNSAKESIEIGNHRVEIMKKYKVIR